MILLLLIFCIIFIVYEIYLNNFYKKDLQNEKLIAYFSDTRMQLMKMLHMREIKPISCYFDFMMRATSYSIRTIYFKKKKYSLEQLNYLEAMFNTLNSDELKNEFKELNSEQKELFARTAMNIIELYFSREFRKKLLWSLYVLKASYKILYLFGLIRRVLFTFESDKDINRLDDIEKSYKLSQYALA